MTSSKANSSAYALAKERYAELGVDTEKALERLQKFSISLHCWQADDVGGYETPDAILQGGGIQATGNFPGKARNIEEHRADMEKAYSLIPGSHRFNMHASYGDFGGKKVDRDGIEPAHFESWVDWANQIGIKLDFNSTCFSHPKADSGFTLSSLDNGVREFWIEHVNRARNISAYMDKETGSRVLL